MPNGKSGDHPYTDIVVHNRPIYTATVCSLVREIASLADPETCRQLSQTLWQDFNDREDPDIPRLESWLTELRDRLLGEARGGECES